MIEKRVKEAIEGWIEREWRSDVPFAWERSVLWQEEQPGERPFVKCAITFGGDVVPGSVQPPPSFGLATAYLYVEADTDRESRREIIDAWCTLCRRQKLALNGEGTLEFGGLRFQWPEELLDRRQLADGHPYRWEEVGDSARVAISVYFRIRP